MPHCDFCDVEEVERVSEVLLTILAHSIVNAKATKDKEQLQIKQDLIKHTETFHGDFLAAVEKPTKQRRASNTQLYFSEWLRESFEKFAEDKKTIFKSLANALSSGSIEDKIYDTRTRLARTNVWPSGERTKVASSLLRRLGLPGTHFCADEADDEHRLMCVFRPMPCRHVGCSAFFSALWLDKHDAGCPFMLVQCDQVCDELVRRMDMQDHIVTSCPNTPIACLFADVGCCSEPVLRGELQKHLDEKVHHHLQLAVKQIHVQNAMITDLSAQIVHVNAQIDHQAVVTQLTIDTMRDMGAEVAKLRKTLAKTTSMSEQEQKEVAALQKKVSLLTKEIERNREDE